MRQRSHTGKPAEITFTCDFHELVAGDLLPGRPLLLRYDPHRIIPAGEPYRFGDPDQPVTAHLQFHDGAAPTETALRSPSGVIPCPDVDLTGQGSMLSAQLALPADADLLIVWFSYKSAPGAVHHDSDYGANYRFGFPCQEITIVKAIITGNPDDSAADRFDLVLHSVADVEDVAVHYSLASDLACAEHEVRLQPLGRDAARPDALRWATAINVPHRAIVRFRVCYWIGGRRLIDDNAGSWYLAPEPQPDETPPPPAALLEAAAAWR